MITLDQIGRIGLCRVPAPDGARTRAAVTPSGWRRSFRSPSGRRPSRVNVAVETDSGGRPRSLARPAVGTMSVAPTLTTGTGNRPARTHAYAVVLDTPRARPAVSTSTTVGRSTNSLSAIALRGN